MVWFVGNAGVFDELKVKYEKGPYSRYFKFVEQVCACMRMCVRVCERESECVCVCLCGWGWVCLFVCLSLHFCVFASVYV